MQTTSDNNEEMHDERLCILLCGLLMASSANAGRITLNNPDEQELPGGKRLCIYTSSAAGAFTYITKSKKCAAIKTFDTSQAE